jgi:membrane-bound inhibitor of C-type lysozyme
MDNRFVRPAWPALACCLLLLAGCSSVSLWPFGEGKERDPNVAPSNATEYRCAGGKVFYLRYLDNGGAAWIIFPDREFRLDKVGSSGTRFSNGMASLDIRGDEATLTDGSAISLTGCKIPAAK